MVSMVTDCSLLDVTSGYDMSRLLKWLVVGVVSMGGAGVVYDVVIMYRFSSNVDDMSRVASDHAHLLPSKVCDHTHLLPSEPLTAWGIF